MAQTLSAAGHVLDLLRLLMEAGEVGVSEAASRLAVAPSTAHRLLTTLVSSGFAVRTPARRYRVAAEFAQRPRPNEIGALVARVRPAVRGAFERVGETVHLVVLTGTDVQFVDGVEGGQALRIGLRIGARIPAYCTSGGKAILAALEPTTVDALHSDGLPPWPGRRLTTLDQLREELAEIRTRGMSVNRGESEAGVIAFGRAICRPDGTPAAALAIALPQSRFRDGEERALADALLEGADRAGVLLEG